jgi:hypothetical protein
MIVSSSKYKSIGVYDLYGIRIKYVSRYYMIRRHLVHKYRVICVATGGRNTNPQLRDRPVADLRRTPTGHRDRSKNDIFAFN